MFSTSYSTAHPQLLTMITRKHLTISWLPGHSFKKGWISIGLRYQLASKNRCKIIC